MYFFSGSTGIGNFTAIPELDNAGVKEAQLADGVEGGKGGLQSREDTCRVRVLQVGSQAFEDGGQSTDIIQRGMIERGKELYLIHFPVRE